MADIVEQKKKRAPKRKGTKGKGKAEKAVNDAAHLAVVLEAARVTVGILSKEGIPSSIFGSLASRLYGAQRCPKDVDLLIYQDPKQTAEPWIGEALKKLMLDKDPVHFYLTLPRNPQDTYRILWYRQYYLGPGCKVDLLTPGIMHLPNLDPTSYVWKESVPLVPFPLLLLHKLQGWDDHRVAEEPHKRRKMPQDAADIRRLLGMEGLVRGVVGSSKGGALWEDREMFSEEFEELTRRRVRDYCEAFPKSVGRWRSMGFEVPDPVPKKKGEGNVIRVKDKNKEVEKREALEEDEDEVVVEDSDSVEDEEAKQGAEPISLGTIDVGLGEAL